MLNPGSKRSFEELFGDEEFCEQQPKSRQRRRTKHPRRKAARKSKHPGHGMSARRIKRPDW